MRLGVWQIAAPIGEGDMGQVYRATDTKLKRQVAVKILPPSLAADHDRLARFQREAGMLASLNHPNIAAIYGLEESRGITALVMELVEGEDLSQRILYASSVLHVEPRSRRAGIGRRRVAYRSANAMMFGPAATAMYWRPSKT